MSGIKNLYNGLLVILILIGTQNIDAQKVGTSIGDVAPEISEEGINGEMINLSSLKGKIVLIDFWASWCGPCRRENPTVVKAYNTYKVEEFTKGAGFTVFGVSLDKKKGSWTEAIVNDKLSWPYHVSDLKGWESKWATLYGVRSIPANYLIDANGIIIAKDLRGEDLIKTLDNLKK